MTDTLASWVEQGFLAGPFKFPPLPKFRVNPLKVVAKQGKIRPVLNVSSPIGRSFNDNIQVAAMEKVVMTSACKFGSSILEAGRGAKMTKFDKKDAYKNVPCNLADLRLQGLQWGGRFFVELDQIFGSKAAACNYDTLDNSTVALTKAVCSIPKKFVHRQLDDTPVVGPATNNWCEQFTSEYKKLCDSLGMKLAPDCPDCDKAFTLSTRGKVLGIVFDSTELSWTLPEEKRAEYMNMITRVLTDGELTIETAESLLGKLNFVTAMAPFMKTFKFTLQVALKSLIEAEQESLPLSEELAADLRTWWAFIRDNSRGFPIPAPSSAPPLRYKSVTTDASGWKPMSCSDIDAALGAVVLSEDGLLEFVSQVRWSFSDSSALWDSKSKYLGCKTTSLEMAGLLIPLLLLPEKLAGQHVVVGVDNIGCHWICKKGYSSSDSLSSVLARLVSFVAAKYCIALHVVHVPRLSTWESSLADRLSRARTTTKADSALLSAFPSPPLPAAFAAWMADPFEDWDMPLRVLRAM